MANCFVEHPNAYDVKTGATVLGGNQGAQVALCGNLVYEFARDTFLAVAGRGMRRNFSLRKLPVGTAFGSAASVDRLSGVRTSHAVFRSTRSAIAAMLRKLVIFRSSSSIFK